MLLYYYSSKEKEARKTCYSSWWFWHQRYVHVQAILWYTRCYRLVSKIDTPCLPNSEGCTIIQAAWPDSMTHYQWTLYFYTTYPLSSSLCSTQTFQHRPSYGSSHSVSWRSPSITTWSTGKTRRRDYFDSMTPLLLPPSGASTETDPTWHTIKLHELFATTTSVTFSTKSVEGSPTASARG